MQKVESKIKCCVEVVYVILLATDDMQFGGIIGIMTKMGIKV